MRLKILAAVALLSVPGLAAAQSSAVEAALAAAEDYRDDEARTILREACDAQDSEACQVLLADLNGSYSEEEEVEARTLASQLCDGGDVLACATLARYADNGQGGGRSDVLKRTSLVTACRGGLLSACSEAANMAEYGDGGDQDMELARELAGKGCAGEHATSCYQIGSYLQTRGWEEESEVQQMAVWQQARRAFQRACDLGENTACDSLATMLLEGRGGDKDRAGALALQQKACNENFYSCDTWLRSMKP